MSTLPNKIAFVLQKSNLSAVRDDNLLLWNFAHRKIGLEKEKNGC